MDLQIRTISDDELPAYLRATELAFSGVLQDDELERERTMVEPDRCFAALDGGDIVGTAGVFTMPMTVPGGELVVGFVTAVGVRPTHRRRGINTQLMRRELDDAHDRGELVEVLYASEGGIYGRYGYGLGTFGLSIEVKTAHSAFVRGHEPAGAVRLVERHEAVKHILAVNEATRLERPGMVHLDERRLDYVLGHEHGEEKKLPTIFVVHEGDDGVDGFAEYKVKHEWPRGYPQSILTLRDLQAATPNAYADLWRFVLDVDLIEKVEAWNRPVDEALVHLVQEPIRLGARLMDNLWVRLVEVAGSLRARRYATDGRVVFEVADPFAPWNEGRYALEVSAGEVTVHGSAEAPADVVCTVNELGAAYLGGVSFRQLQRAGRVEERTEGALARADAMFGWDPAPWSPYDY